MQAYRLLSLPIIDAGEPQPLPPLDMDLPITKSARPRREGETMQDADRANDAMRQHWNSTVCEEFDIPDRYQSVAVLLIHWADWLDTTLKCRAEVSDARTM